MSVDNGAAGDEVSTIRDELRRLVLSGEAAVSVRERTQITEKTQEFVLRVRDSTAGRKAVEGLLHDPSARVRLVTAVKTLKWNPALAIPIIKEVARRDNEMLGLEAGIVLKEYEAGRLDLDWEPKPKRHRQSKSRRPPVKPSRAQLDAAVAVHSTTMSGGFLNSLAVSGTLFADAIAGYEAIGLPAAAELVRRALAVLAVDQLPADHDERVGMVDGLPDDDAQGLEDLSDQYQDLFPSDDLLFAAIDSASEPEKG